jgi:hypothetical protein
MGTPANNDGRTDLKALLGEIVGHVERLAGQQVEMLKAELAQAAREAGGAAVMTGAGVGLLAVGGVLSTAAAVHLLHRATRLPLWACYGLAAGAAGAAGVGLVSTGRAKFGQLQGPLLPQSAASLRENVVWLRDQLTTTRA